MMEFSEKLQSLRKQRGLTQEELAASIYVSRTAISKWESGRGYPSIDSLKALSGFFSITIDELLSGDEVLLIAETDGQEKKKRLCNVIFGLLDCAMLLLCFLPLFGQPGPAGIQSVVLPALTGMQPWLKITCYAVILSTVLLGIAILSLQYFSSSLWQCSQRRLSLIFTVSALLLFTLIRQPYCATLVLVFLLVKVWLLFEMR